MNSSNMGTYFLWVEIKVGWGGICFPPERVSCTYASIFDFMSMSFHLTAECYHSEWISKMYDMHSVDGHHWIPCCHQDIALPVPQGGGQPSLLLKRVIRETSRIHGLYVLYQTTEHFKPLEFVPEGTMVGVPLELRVRKVHIACLV